ncbi:ribonuclease 3 [Clostridium acetireducens DSM 10703]|jgi:ribonuclease-3|uniref:Ribonuclease 3 n=1 Tax=Clostridium acetireducens DSM 10703 TaxID=1121290 RepID=A0A1E8F224_9CLOT|nr:ribonuclease III [Clostridium acetireducens]OFI07695.1 ribonuclease 3 [Clostridium acetireducens DSM 10703]
MKYRYIILKQLEYKLNLKFNNIELLDIALTHSSFANQKKHVQFNERLEFLGDSVLQLCISELLFKKYKDKSEGELTKLRSLIVCETSLYNISLKWNLGEYINMSKGEELTGGRERVSILADCVEAIIAAIYLDEGYEAAKKFIVYNFNNIIEKAEKNEIVFDYKTKLQETLQENGDAYIQYNLSKFEGPPHRRKFYIQVIANKDVIGYGCGFSKKEAEQNAAKKALEILED